ncbi:hypothetical protein BGX29_008472, partial [Mortierella sp. GBA35]
YAALIRLNPTIKDLYIDVKKMDTSPGFWEAASTSLENPRRLHVHGFEVFKGDALDSFWRARSRFEEIPCSGFGFANSFVLPTLLCPNLTKLHWHNLWSEFPMESLAESLGHKHSHG